MAKEPSVTTSVTQYSIARVRTDQRFATMFAHARATNGDSTHRTKRTSRRRGVLRPARSVKPTEPTAPATTAIRAPARSRSRNPPSGLPRFALEVMSPGPFMLIDPPWCLMVRAYFAPSVPYVTNIDPHDPCRWRSTYRQTPRLPGRRSGSAPVDSDRSPDVAPKRGGPPPRRRDHRNPRLEAA